jgi:hypothetical protein
MKKLALILTLICSATLVHAAGGHHVPPASSSQSFGLGFGTGGNGTGGNASTTIKDRLQIPFTPSAVAPNVNPATGCDLSVVGSSAKSLPIYSESEAGQKHVVVLGLCVCYTMKDQVEKNACVHNYTCESDPVYKKIHPKSCPNEVEYEKDKPIAGFE